MLPLRASTGLLPPERMPADTGWEVSGSKKSKRRKILQRVVPRIEHHDFLRAIEGFAPLRSRPFSR